MKKNFNMNKTGIWWLIFLLVEVIGSVLLCGFLKFPLYMIILIPVIYIIINYIVFWGQALGITGYILHSFLNKTDLAVKFYEIAVRNKKTSAYALVSYGLILLRNGDNDTPIELFQRVLNMKDINILQSKSATTNLALCYWQKGDIDKAITLLLECIEKFEYINPDTYATLGYLFILKNNYDKALEFTNKALEDNPKHASSLDNLGQIYYRLGDLDKAYGYFEAAIAVKDTLADSQYYLGIIEENKGNAQAAKEYFTKAHQCKITTFNTVTQKQVEDKYLEYSNSRD
jgi:tetratricopeptide (TPR) repeat protein